MSPGSGRQFRARVFCPAFLERCGAGRGRSGAGGNNEEGSPESGKGVGSSGPETRKRVGQGQLGKQVVAMEDEVDVLIPATREMTTRAKDY